DGCGPLNAFMPAGRLKADGGFPKEALQELNRHVARRRLSMRARDRLLRIARTIADLDAEESVHPGHIAAAVQFRPSVHPSVSTF
ncbi:MAG: hypothetical protein HKN17_02315, partial [Rhodothermales bacterium]|nr:hypothetical protein [Rhodothermales bacterium]